MLRHLLISNIYKNYVIQPVINGKLIILMNFIDALIGTSMEKPKALRELSVASNEKISVCYFICFSSNFSHLFPSLFG